MFASSGDMPPYLDTYTYLVHIYTSNYFPSSSKLWKSRKKARSHYNLGGWIFRLVGCSSILVPVGIKVRAKTPKPTIPDSNPNPNPNPDPDPKPQPKRAKTAHKRGAAPRLHRARKFLDCRRRLIPKRRPRYAIFKSKTSLKVPSPRLLNLLR